MKNSLILLLACLAFSPSARAEDLERQYENYNRAAEARRNAELARCETRRKGVFQQLIQSALGRFSAGSQENRILSLKASPVKDGNSNYGNSGYYTAYEQTVYAKLQSGEVCRMNFSMYVHVIRTEVSMSSVVAVCQDRYGRSAVRDVSNYVIVDVGCSYVYPHGVKQ
jgi:hypothetical protein